MPIRRGPILSVPTLRPFWCYYGGKWRAAPRYPKPRYGTIIEPFAGAAGYALRYSDREVILVEKYPVIAEIWRFLIRSSPADIRLIPCVEHVDALPDATPQGAKLLVGFSMNNATTAPRKQLSSGKRKLAAMGRRRGGWCDAQRNLIAAQVNAIKHWTIIEGDYSMAPNIEATWYIDAPYQRAGVHYIHPATAIDFELLGLWCTKRSGQTIVCEAEGAGWLPFKPLPEIGRAHV